MSNTQENEDDENKKRKRGGHLERNKVKIGILEFILRNDGPITESEIRKFVEKSYAIKDQKTVNTHLHDLKDLGCIELIPPQKGFPNKWNITKIKHLKNIRSNFENIKLNECEKSLNVILKESGYDITTLEGLKVYIRLLLSVSLFNMFMEADIESVYYGAFENYKYGRGFQSEQTIKKNLNKYYTTYIKGNSNYEMSRETFHKTVEESFFKIYEETYPGWLKGNRRETYTKIIGEMIGKGKKAIILKHEFLRKILKIYEEKFPLWPTEMPINTYLTFIMLLDNISVDSGQIFFKEEIRKLCKKKFPGLPVEKELEMKIFNETIKVDLEMYSLMENIISLMKKQIFRFVVSRFDLLFEHCFYHDRLTGAVSPDELKFAIKIKENFEEYISSHPESEYNRTALKKMLLSDLEIESEIIFDHNQPRIFSNNCNSSDDVYQGLREFIGFQHLLE